MRTRRDKSAPGRRAHARRAHATHQHARATTTVAPTLAGTKEALTPATAWRRQTRRCSTSDRQTTQHAAASTVDGTATTPQRQYAATAAHAQVSMPRATDIHDGRNGVPHSTLREDTTATAEAGQATSTRTDTARQQENATRLYRAAPRRRDDATDEYADGATDAAGRARRTT